MKTTKRPARRPKRSVLKAVNSTLQGLDSTDVACLAGEIRGVAWQLRAMFDLEGAEKDNLVCFGLDDALYAASEQLQRLADKALGVKAKRHPTQAA